MEPPDLTNVTSEILTLEEARRRLTPLRPLVARLMEITAELASVDQERRRLAERASRAKDAAAALAARGGALQHEFDATLRAVNDLGGYVKDPSVGLLDFYSWRGEELVFLCWRHGEDTVRFWHPLDGGLRGRQAVDA